MNRFDYRDLEIPLESSLGRVVALAAGGLIGAVDAHRLQRRPALADRHAAIRRRRQPGGDQQRRAAQCPHPGAADRRLSCARARRWTWCWSPINQSPDVADKLVGVTTDIGKVTVTGDPTLPASGVLFVGTPERPEPRKPTTPSRRPTRSRRPSR